MCRWTGEVESAVSFKDNNICLNPERSCAFINHFEYDHQEEAEALEEGAFESNEWVSSNKEDDACQESHFAGKQPNDKLQNGYKPLILQLTLEFNQELVFNMLQRGFQEHLQRNHQDRNENAKDSESPSNFLRFDFAESFLAHQI